MAAIINTQDLLSQKIYTLGFSKNFQDICKRQKLYTLQNIIDLGHQDIAHNPVYTIPWFNELMDFLDQRQMLYLLNTNVRGGGY
ncbi:MULTISPECIES: hypothetical protein [Olivibacter]|uniref:Uncharacterized protein n=1 Tax=Olivibacter jilunii TaxID=985016 RepID=A0ABW6B0W2_9SPHI|nr:hypothetical protein [Olivibacter jilunii]MDX3914804.1 hypothetical protein [Pseudosphingobacterium sp.]QEL03423.1 hypothetical protein FKG96_22195 [Olivibacter sp. LS-1]